MEILTPEQMAAKLDFARPLNSPPEERESLWCIPFEYGGIAKGTKISVALAKTIAAELRAAIAEAEKRELYRAFKAEEARVASCHEQIRKSDDARFEALQQVADLKRKLARRAASRPR